MKNHDRLAIVQMKRGKYYTLLPIDELKAYIAEDPQRYRNIIATLTPSDLASFVTNTQIGMKLQECPHD